MLKPLTCFTHCSNHWLCPGAVPLGKQRTPEVWWEGYEKNSNTRSASPPVQHFGNGKRPLRHQESYVIRVAPLSNIIPDVEQIVKHRRTFIPNNMQPTEYVLRTSTFVGRWCFWYQKARCCFLYLFDHKSFFVHKSIHTNPVMFFKHLLTQAVQWCYDDWCLKLVQCWYVVQYLNACSILIRKCLFNIATLFNI